MIVVSRNLKHIRIFAGVPRGRGANANDSEVVEERNFHRLLLAICSEILDRICKDIQPFDGFSKFSGVPKCMILNEPE